VLICERKVWTPDNCFLLEYEARCGYGEFIIGQELWLELNKLAEDLKNDRYEYDRYTALLRMDFMEHGVRLTKSPYYGKPMVLMLWQKAFIEAAYSFKMAQESRDMGFWIDRFQKILLLIARKNTKTETCSGIALAEFVTGPDGADLVCASNDDRQSALSYEAINTMRQLIDPKDLDTKRTQTNLLNKQSNTKIFKLSMTSRNREGFNIDWAIIDEIHEMKTNDLAQAIEQSQSTKDNPKVFEITTEGHVEGGYLDDELAKFRAVLNGEDTGPDAERMLPWLYTMDSEQEVWLGNRDNRLWEKANPTLPYGIKKYSYLERKVAAARSSVADKRFVLPKDFNIKQAGTAPWLERDMYAYSATYDLEQFRGCICLGAVDLAETTDLCCAKILLMKPDDKTKYIYTRYFIPESKLLPENDDHEAGAKYKEWVQQDLITVTPGNDNDLALVADWFMSLYQDYDIRLWKCGYDNRFSKDWLRRMREYGWTTDGDEQTRAIVMIIQSAESLNNALRLTEADLRHQLLNFNENPVDVWCFGNAALKIDTYGKALCVKQQAKAKIDGTVATIILEEMYRRNRTEFAQAIALERK
jgi:phage terminase large subunit-like protein